MNKKMCQVQPDVAPCLLRVWHRKAFKKTMPRYLVKCGCCDEAVEIYYGEGTLEINGVLGTVDDWRELLLPLLEKV